MPGIPVATLGFSGGDKLDKVLADLAKRASNATAVNVGFLGDKTYPDGTSVAQVAFWNEFGTSKAPARPFFRRMIDKNSEYWGGQLGAIATAVKYDSKRALDLMGEKIKDDLVGSINSFNSPGNSEATIARKGFNKPLIDTGVMIRSVASKVIE